MAHPAVHDERNWCLRVGNQQTSGVAIEVACTLFSSFFDSSCSGVNSHREPLTLR